MEGLLELIIDKISNPVVLVGILIFISVLYFLGKGLNTFIGKINPSDIFKLFKRKRHKYGLSDLAKHDLFTEIEHNKRHKYDFYTHGELDITKSLIFSDFLKIKMESTKDNMLRISSEASGMSRQELKHHIDMCFLDCNDCLEMSLKELFREKAIDIEKSEIIIRKFYKIREVALDRYTRRIDSIFASDFYQSNYNLILALYEIIAFELDDIIRNSIEAFDDINGMFKDIENYK